MHFDIFDNYSNVPMVDLIRFKFWLSFPTYTQILKVHLIKLYISFLLTPALIYYTRDLDKLQLTYGGLVLCSSQFLILPDLPEKRLLLQKGSKVTQEL